MSTTRDVTVILKAKADGMDAFKRLNAEARSAETTTTRLNQQLAKTAAGGAMAGKAMGDFGVKVNRTTAEVGKLSDKLGQTAGAGLVGNLNRVKRAADEAGASLQKVGSVTGG